MFIRGCRRCMQIRAQSGPVSICVLLCELRNVARYYERDSLSYYSCSVSFRFFLLFFSFILFVRVSILRSPWMITLSEQTLVLLFTFVIYFFLYYCAPRSFEDRSVSLLF